MLSNRNCFKLLVKMITASPIARCPSFKFLTMQMQPPASWARNCGPFYPRPPCSQTSRTASDDLAPVAALAIGLPAQRAIAQRFSALGTKRTCRGRLTMSAPEGKTDVPREAGHWPFLTHLRHVGDERVQQRTTSSREMPSFCDLGGHS